MIHAEGLTKKFGSLTAVDDLTLDVAEGGVSGFLGPIGAGKTTSVRMLTSLIARTSGSAEVAGCVRGKPADELRLRGRIVLLPENVGLYEAQSAFENLAYYGNLSGMERGRLAQNIEGLLRMLELWEKRGLPIATFSKGMILWAESGTRTYRFGLAPNQSGLGRAIRGDRPLPAPL